MQVWKIPHSEGQRFGVLLFEHFSNHCLANVIEPLRAANDLLGWQAYTWEILTLDGGPATSSSGFPIMAQRPLSHARGDGLILLPSYGYRQLATPSLDRALRSAAARFDQMIGLDTGSWLMAHAGLLDGHVSTIHHEEYVAYCERFPELDIQRSRWIVDRNRITGGGAMTAFELFQHLIGERHGQAVTLGIASLFMQSDSTEPRQQGHQGHHRDKYVARALAEMQSSVENPVSVAEIAQRCGCRQRQLETRFQASLGTTPQAVYRRLRLTQARKLVLEEPQSVAEIALRCGYEDPSAFTRAFRAEFGQTPRQMRG